jgi:hypothetical protein
MRRASANSLRREVHARAALRPVEHETSFGVSASVLYAESEDGSHGNFLTASYRRICADAEWRKRLEKSYTAGAWLPRKDDRWRGELECASSSDALLMNLFCYPRVMLRAQVCALLGVDVGTRPEFGVRAGLEMRRDEVDRTELDMRLGDLLVEAKLTEGGFGKVSRERLMRYIAMEEVFEIDGLPWQGASVQGYQLIRGVLAARAQGARFLVLCDGRRQDMAEMWFRVLSAVRSYELRGRMQLLSWQELAGAMPSTVQQFLAAKYGILAD